MGWQKPIDLKLTPSCAFFRKKSMRDRSLVHVALIALFRFSFALVSRSHNLLMKWCTKGKIVVRHPNLPMFDSSSIVIVVFLSIIACIASVHAMCLFDGSDILSCLKSMFQPRIVLVSVSSASAKSLLSATRGMRGMGLFEWTGLPQVWKASRGVQLSRIA